MKGWWNLEECVERDTVCIRRRKRAPVQRFVEEEELISDLFEDGMKMT